MALTIIRWYFGLTYVLGGVGAFLAGPVMIVMGNWGGVYMIVGGVEIAALGWAIHPWGLQRLLSTRRARVA